MFIFMRVALEPANCNHEKFLPDMKFTSLT